MKNPRFRQPVLLIPVVLLTLTAASCGKSVETDGLNGAPSITQTTGKNGPDDTKTATTGPTCTTEQRVTWRFVQPQPTLHHTVDLLIVADTSTSLNAKRARIAAQLPAFISHLSAQTNYRVGVMLAHGGASNNTGRLFAASGSNLVLNSRDLTAAQIQTQLTNTLLHPAADVDETEGEAMMYSAQRSLGSDRLPQIQAQGFYRPEAALSIVFVTDENDVCYPPELHGYFAWPDYVPSPRGVEAIAYQKYCADPGGSAKITPESTLAQFQAFKSAEKLNFGGIVHSNPAGVPHAGEDSIGHGILELLGLVPDSVSLDLNLRDYSAGLAQLANVASLQLDLKTLFDVTDHGVLDPTTLLVTVDAQTVHATYAAQPSQVQLSVTDAGHAGSVVQISACPK